MRHDRISKIVDKISGDENSVDEGMMTEDAVLVTGSLWTASECSPKLEKIQGSRRKAWILTTTFRK